MLDLGNLIDLPLTWGLIIATAVFLYVCLDGFDLGVGILFPFAPSNKSRSEMMNSIAPFWDGNETWLVLSGGGLLAVFPLAYSVIMSALYIPIISMLIFLILRGVSLEFRYKSQGKDQLLWDVIFHIGSVGVAFCQGLVLGTFIQGFQVVDGNLMSNAFSWLSPFSLITAIALVFGYALLGSTWTILKTTDRTKIWAQKATLYTLAFVGLFIAIISITMPIIDPRIAEVWFSMPRFSLLLIVPLLTLLCFIGCLFSTIKNHDFLPFIYVILIFFLCYIGLGISLYPWIVPFEYTIYDAAANSKSQSFILVGTVFLLPIILSYTAYNYYVFKGKSDHENLHNNH